MSQMQLVEDRLREAILALDLKPGERLSERQIEARFAASRTPVRAALFRLESEGLVVGNRSQGANPEHGFQSSAAQSRLPSSSDSRAKKEDTYAPSTAR